MLKVYTIELALNYAESQTGDGGERGRHAAKRFQTTAAAEDSATVDMVHAEPGQLSGSHRKTF